MPIMGGISGRPGDNIGLGESIPVRMNGDLTYPYYTCIYIYIHILYLLDMDYWITLYNHGSLEIKT